MGGTLNGLRQIKEAAQNYQEDMVKFLRAIVKILEKAAMKETYRTIEAE